MKTFKVMNRPEYRFCEMSNVRCQSKHCMEKNSCYQQEWSSKKPNVDTKATAERHNRYLGWPETGTPFEDIPMESRREQQPSSKHPPKRYCEGSPQLCQNSICLSTNKCGLVVSSPGSVSITAKSIRCADAENKSMGWPRAGTPACTD